MKSTRNILAISIVILLPVVTVAQIPRNLDSVKLIYERVIAASDSNGPKMRFSTEINGKEVRHTSNDYAFEEGDGKKSMFQLNAKNELWKMPNFQSDSIKLLFVGKKISITSGYLKKAYLAKGGSVYFGVVDNFKKMAERFDKDEEYHTLLNNKHRGLSAILGSENVRKAVRQITHPFRLYYFVLERGINQTLYFYLK